MICMKKNFVFKHDSKIHQAFIVCPDLLGGFGIYQTTEGRRYNSSI